jgi:hypothetical protein
MHELKPLDQTPQRQITRAQRRIPLRRRLQLGMAPKRHIVTIHYREPTLEGGPHRGVVRLRPYRASYEVIARTQKRAWEQALEEFRFDAVGTPSARNRKVVRVECQVVCSGHEHGNS